MNQLIPEELLARSKKILFVTHLAIGDFTYLQNYFRLFAEKYPHIKIDLWIDEIRRTRCFWCWGGMKNYVLFDWVKTSGLFNKIYSKTYSWRRFYRAVDDAQLEEYPIVVSLCTVRWKFYVKYARKISPKGFVVGIVYKNKKHKECRLIRQLDAFVVAAFNLSTLVVASNPASANLSSATCPISIVAFRNACCLSRPSVSSIISSMRAVTSAAPIPKVSNLSLD